MPKGVLFFPSYYEAIRDLPDADRLQMYDSIIIYGLYGEEVELPLHLRGYFALIRPNMDNANKRYANACENGKKGGRPRKNQPGFFLENQEYKKEKESEQEKEQERDTKGEPAQAEQEFERKRAAALSALDRFTGFR